MNRQRTQELAIRRTSLVAGAHFRQSYRTMAGVTRVRIIHNAWDLRSRIRSHVRRTRCSSRRALGRVAHPSRRLHRAIAGVSSRIGGAGTATDRRCGDRLTGSGQSRPCSGWDSGASIGSGSPANGGCGDRLTGCRQSRRRTAGNGAAGPHIGPAAWGCAGRPRRTVPRASTAAGSARAAATGPTSATASALRIYGRAQSQSGQEHQGYRLDRHAFPQELINGLTNPSSVEALEATICS
jgi:hypothetical protein